MEADRVFKLQKKCIRAISNAFVWNSCKPLFTELNILPLPCMYIRDLCYMVKQQPKYFKLYSAVLGKRVRPQYARTLHAPISRLYIKKMHIICALNYIINYPIILK